VKKDSWAQIMPRLLRPLTQWPGKSADMQAGAEAIEMLHGPWLSSGGLWAATLQQRGYMRDSSRVLIAPWESSTKRIACFFFLERMPSGSEEKRGCYVSTLETWRGACHLITSPAKSY